tara:strand:- start:383 stop:631 length:249 start_codon:yes stop_codon:yes gene_type:complete
MATRKRTEDIPLNIYLPEPITILIGVLAFVLGFLYRKHSDKEDIADAFDEGFEKGTRDVVKALSNITGRDIQIELEREDMDR